MACRCLQSAGLAGCSCSGMGRALGRLPPAPTKPVPTAVVPRAPAAPARMPVRNQVHTPRPAGPPRRVVDRLGKPREVLKPRVPVLKPANFPTGTRANQSTNTPLVKPSYFRPPRPGPQGRPSKDPEGKPFPQGPGRLRRPQLNKPLPGYDNAKPQPPRKPGGSPPLLPPRGGPPRGVQPPKPAPPYDYRQPIATKPMQAEIPGYEYTPPAVGPGPITSSPVDVASDAAFDPFAPNAPMLPGEPFLPYGEEEAVDPGTELATEGMFANLPSWAGWVAAAAVAAIVAAWSFFKRSKRKAA